MKLDVRVIAFATLVLAYASFAISIGNAPLQDVPNHLARVHIIEDTLFNHGQIYGQNFHVQVVLTPYFSGDLLLALLDHIVGTDWVARLWIAAAVLLLPLGMHFVLKSLMVPRDAAMVGVILSLYIATNWCFVMGFLNYQLGLGLALIAYGWFLRARDASSLGSWLCYALFTFLGYAMHLSALLFIFTFVCASLLADVLQRKTSPWPVAVMLCVPLLLLVAHLTVAGGQEAQGDWPTNWGSVSSKIIGLFAPVRRFEPVGDIALLAMFLGATLYPLGYDPIRSLKTSAGLWLSILAFVALYFMLPSNRQNIYFIDVRALPYVMVFILITSVVAASQSPTLMGTQFAVACILAASNLIYTATIIYPQDSALARYRVVAAAVPADARVLPINTRPAIGRYRPFLHAGSYVTLDAHAWTPHLFAADLNPPMLHFRYAATRGDAPDEWWYEALLHKPRPVNYIRDVPDWRRIEASFEYVLVTVPWDPLLVPSTYPVIARNEVAALLKVSSP